MRVTILDRLYHHTFTYFMALCACSACLRTGEAPSLSQSGSEAESAGHGAGGEGRGGEGGSAPEAEACSVGIGSCRARGVFIETPTGRQCDASPALPQVEQCNEPGAVAEDEDCDGRINEGLDLAQCPVCSEGVTSTTEVCDGQDNDCDGLVDERLSIPSRLSRGVCVAEEAKLRCIDGTYVDPDYTQIDGYEGPDELSCDGQDNDCDGLVDEKVSAQCEICTEVRVERCDGLDNDCDFLIDEGCPP